MRFAGVGLMLLFVAAGCGTSSRAIQAITADANQGATTTANRCAPAPLRRGRPPRWASGAPSQTPYALATGDKAAAFFFVYLRAGHPSNPANKILWVVGLPRQGKPLKIVARFSRRRVPIVRSTWPANSGPGEIYPSTIDLPKPGCWHLALAWAGHHASIDVNVAKR
jgi:hypothetical protein